MVEEMNVTMTIGEHKFDLTPFTEISYDRACKMSIPQDWARALMEEKARDVADMVRAHGLKMIRNK